MHQKAGRSGQFYAVMMMSPGRGLATPGRGLDFLDTERYLPTRTILARSRGEVSKIGATQDLERSTGLESMLISDYISSP